MNKLKLLFAALGLLKDVVPILVRVIKPKKQIGEQQMSEYGIKETLEALEFGIPFANKIDDATQDGLQVLDAVTIAPTLVSLPKAVTGAKDIPREMADLNDIERQQIVDKVKELDFVDDAAEKIGEKGLNFIAALAELLAAIREAKEAKAE